MDGMKPQNNPKKPTSSDDKEIHVNTHSKNCLFELVLVCFNQVFTHTKANEIWLKVQELHDSSSIIREKKQNCLTKQTDDVSTHPNEIVKDMYSR